MNTVIEINGRKYDAQTGKIIADLSTANTNTPIIATKVNTVLTNGSLIDGFSRRRPFKRVASDIPVKKAAPVALAYKNDSAIQTRSLDIIPPIKRTQKARTLLRSVVKKPQKAQQLMHGSSSAMVSEVQQSATGRGFLLKRTAASRAPRAEQTAPSSAISRFANLKLNSKPKLSSEIKVVKQINNDALQTATPIIGFPMNNTQKQDVFNHTSAQCASQRDADVPKVKLHKKVLKGLHLKSKTISVATASLALLIFAGFFAYQNMPSFAMRVAASRAGFSGRLPGNIPTGYAFKGPIKYSKSIIALNYQSNSDERKFVITQKPTEWSSESLLTNYLVSSNLRYQTYHDKGLTVYIYNEGNATWVDKGVWYSVSGEGSLSSDQILAIAGSM